MWRLAALLAAALLIVDPTQQARALQAGPPKAPSGEYDLPAITPTLDQDEMGANLRQPGRLVATGSKPTEDHQEQRPMDCKYIPKGTVMTSLGVAVLRYDQLRQYFEPGTVFGYSCYYLDDPSSNGITGEYTLGELPPDAATGGLQQQARAALDIWVSQGFPSPEVTGKPSLTNQRVGITSWFGVPTLTQPVTSGSDALRLKATPRPLVTFSVPVGRWGTESFDCPTAPVGPDRRPTSDACTHAFAHATAGPTPATVTIRYDVTYSSTVTGEVDVPIPPGYVDRFSAIEMNVLDLQAVHR